MYGLFRLIRSLFRTIVNQKHPGKQIIMSLTFLLVGGLACYFSIAFIALSDVLLFLPALAIIGFILALLGLLTLPEGIVNAFLRGWDGRRVRRNTKPQPVEPKPLKYVPPKQHHSAAQSKSGRRASQGKQKNQAGQSK